MSESAVNMKESDKKRQAIVSFITEFLEKEQFSPSTREIAEAVGIPHGTSIVFYLNDLRRRGLITWKEGCARTIHPVRKAGK